MGKTVWLFFSISVSVLILIETGCTLFVKDIYRGPETLTVQAMGQDLLTLAIVLPAFIICTIQAIRGSQISKIILIGTLTYLVYTYASYAFMAHFNALFPVYTALFGLCLYMLISLFRTINLQHIAISDNSPVKTTSIVLGIIASLLAILWLSEITPALLAGQVPQTIIESGTATNAIYVLDLAWILPAMFYASCKLWSKDGKGILLAGILLVFAMFMILAIISMALLMILKEQNVELPKLIVFGIVSILTFTFSLRYIKTIRTW